MPVPHTILEQIKQLIPPLNGSLHKGQSGRVGVLGGSLEYTGAPFFAAISAQRLGADLSHVICCPTAAGAIKTYSPDLIVHPMLGKDFTYAKVKSDLETLLDRLHVLVIGPGLGREQYMQHYADLALRLARARGLFVVLDADALLMLGQNVSILKGYRRAVITPNLVEFKRLAKQLGIDEDAQEDTKAGLVSRALGGVTVLQKGPEDIIAIDATSEVADLSTSKIGANNGSQKVKECVRVDVPGGLKRCGGQGDILSGLVGTVLAWGKCYEDGAFGDNQIAVSRIPLLAAVGGSLVTRTTSRRAFLREGRSVVTQDMLPEIGKAFTEVFGQDLQGQDKGKL